MSTKLLRQVKKLTLSVFMSFNLALASYAQFSQFSSKLEKKPTKIYKGSIKYINSKPIKTAILWHVPKFKLLATKLTPQKEALRELQALEILFEGVQGNFPQVQKAYKLSNKSDSIVSLIGKEVINQVNNMTINIDLAKFSNVKSKEDAYEIVSRTKQYLKSNFRIYKQVLFKHQSRDSKPDQRIEKAYNNLLLVSGEPALQRIKALYIRRASNV